ncbi:PTS sugar transporter subunit IIA [Photobacterium sp. DNB23_23_1]
MITQLITPKLIRKDLVAETKQAVFEELADVLAANNKVSDKNGFLADILAREALSVTSMDGIAYPHAKSSFVVEPAIAVGVKSSGIDYDDEEGIEPRVFFMIASPDNGADHHIHVLQELFGKFSDEFIEAVVNADGENKVLDILINS